MVSLEVMIICYLTALIITMNIVSMSSGYAQNSINNTTTNSSQNVSSTNQPRMNVILNPNFTSFNETTDLPLYWNYPPNNCKKYFSCTINFTDGWDDKQSFQLSTTNITNNTWSFIRGREINVNPGEKFQLVSHMKLNNGVTASHVVLEGFNETSKKWYQIIQCPAGLNGSMEWREFSCFITIPENTTEIRPVLNAGWSSQPGKQGTTWFDSISMIKNSSFVTNPTSVEDQKVSNLLSNSNFSMVDNQSGLPLYWSDPPNNCKKYFSCTINLTDGWDDQVSFSLSTDNTDNRRSSIIGNEIEVKPGQKYQLVSHMKLNEWATASHAALEGFNETSKEWYQLMKCPSGTNGPLEWQEFACHRIIPDNTTKARPVLKAGWSSDPKQEAITLFDSLYMSNFEAFSVDSNLKVEVVYEGLDRPTSMAFLAPDDILVLEQTRASIGRIIDGDLQRIPLPVEVGHDGPEQGMLGIVISKNERTNVFLYYTESYGEGVHNRLYRYEFLNNTLKNPKIILDLPSGHIHNGGQMVIGPDKYIYLTIGSASIFGNDSAQRNKALNDGSRDANEPDGRGGILRTNFDGQATNTEGIIGYKEPLNHYYAYGIRNSFGLDFDPITGKLWETENGPSFGDEINLVEPGFNSGWKKVQGIWKVLPKNNQGPVDDHPSDLVDFDGKGKYSSPEFTWNNTAGPTELKFLSTDKLGKQYENDMFLADVQGRIYHFELNHKRTGFILQGPLTDKVADTIDQLDNVIFAKGFSGAVTDLEIGPDGFLYIVALDEGKIYRIVPAHTGLDTLH